MGHHKAAALTESALAKHTAELDKRSKEVYAATFAITRGQKSAAGKSIAGRSFARSFAGRSIAGKSVAGKSIAASGIAPSERTFRTHLTTRELLVGGSEMRELMRSVSPISEPGVNLRTKKQKRKALKSLTRE